MDPSRAFQDESDERKALSELQLGAPARQQLFALDTSITYLNHGRCVHVAHMRLAWDSYVIVIPAVANVSMRSPLALALCPVPLVFRVGVLHP